MHRFYCLLLLLLAAAWPTQAQEMLVTLHQKISATEGNFSGLLEQNDVFGGSIAAIGDFNSDGVPDIAVSAQGDDDSGSNAGALYLLFLNTDGTVSGTQKITTNTGGFTTQLDASDFFGRGTAFLGDVDGDGVGDIAVGARRDDNGGQDRGSVFILFMNSDGSVKSHQKISDTQGNFAGTLDNTDEFGGYLAALGDLNGDGVPDLAVGAGNDDDGSSDPGAERGATWILFLNDDGTVDDFQKISSTEGDLSTGTLDDVDTFAHPGAIGDIDGDGVPDLAVGATGDDDGGRDRGAVYILFMNPTGTVKGQQKISDTQGGLDAALTDGESFGRSPTGVGDLNGDGIPDIAVGAYQNDDGGTNRGALFLLLMERDGTVRRTIKVSTTTAAILGLSDNDRLGLGLSFLGDIDGNGTVELAAGAQFDQPGGTDLGGAVYIFSIDTMKVRTDVEDLDASGLPRDYALAQNYPNPFNPQTTIRYALPQTADVRVAVYDVLGAEVAVLQAGVQAAGVHEVTFDGSDLASGVYLYRLETAGFSLTRRLVLLK